MIKHNISSVSQLTHDLLSALNVVLVGPLLQFNSSYNIRKRF